MKKYIVLIAVLPLLAILMSCNEGGAKADLRKMVDNINRECPIHYDYITCQSAAIQGEEVVMNYIVDESMLSLQLMKEKPDLAKKYGGSSLFNVYDELGSLLVGAGYGFTANYQGSLSGDIVTLRLRRVWKKRNRSMRGLRSIRGRTNRQRREMRAVMLGRNLRARAAMTVVALCQLVAVPHGFQF